MNCCPCLGFHFQQFVEKLLQHAVKSEWQLVLYRLSSVRFGSVYPSCLTLRECIVTNLPLMFVKNLFVGLRDVETILDPEDNLLASEEESKECRQVSVAVGKWS